MKLLSINSQSLTLTKIAELEIFAMENNIDLIAIQETWCNVGSIYEIPGYNCIRNDRHGNQGGTAIYFKSNIKVSTDKKLTVQSINISYEQLVVKVNTPSKSFYIINCYCPRKNLHQFAISSLENTIQSLSEKRQPFVIVGDLNIDLLRSSPESTTMHQFIDEYDMLSHVINPTRITENTQSQIDYVISSADFHDAIVKCLTCTPCNSDHLGLKVELSLDKTAPEMKIKKIRLYKDFNPQSFCDDLISTDWSVFNTNVQKKDIEQAALTLQQTLVSALDKHAPLKTIIDHPQHTPWVTPALRHQLKHRNHLRYVAMTTKKSEDWIAYRLERNKINKSLKSARHQYHRRKFDNCNGDPKETWHLIQKLTKSSKQSKCNIQTTKKLNEMNKFFCEVGEKVKNSCVVTSHDIPSTHPIVPATFDFHKISDIDVIKAVSRFSNWSSPGNDGINGYVLKSSLPAIIKQITTLINMSIQSSIFPTIFKTAQITPIPKIPEAHTPDQHRPISLLSLLSKLTERIIYNQLYHHLKEYLTSSQHGYKLGRSTLTALLEISDKILHAMDNQELSVLVLLDMSKAFDSICHSVLIEKLRSMGLKASAINWISSYLKDRNQFVKVGNLSSDKMYLTCGVPQGSILGPLLFIVYVNDIPAVIKHCKTWQYADDTQLVHSYNPKNINAQTKVSQNINIDLESINNWCQNNFLSLNASKTKAMCIGHKKILVKQTRPTITLSNENIEYVSSAKNLGVTFDEHHTYRTHITNAIKTARYRLINIEKVKHDLPPELLKRIIESMIIQPALYALPVWSSTYPTLLRKFQRDVINKASKIVLGKRKFTQMNDNLTKLNWLNVFQEDEFRTLILAKDLIPSNICPVHNTRQKGEPRLPRVTTDRGKRSFSFRGTKLIQKYSSYNNLPHNQFKNTIRKILTEVI